jgi:hypothetical protein
MYSMYPDDAEDTALCAQHLLQKNMTMLKRKGVRRAATEEGMWQEQQQNS